LAHTWRWKIVYRKISRTWVLYRKEDTVRARLVASGFEEIDGFRRDSPTITESVMRIVLAFASSKGWPVKTTDIKSAFPQGQSLD